MLYMLLAVAFVTLIFAPQLWVRYALWRHSKEIDAMPGTGGELAKHLVERFELTGVRVQEGGAGENYYSPAEKLVSLSPDVFGRKSLSAVAVAAHEVGHAIQFCRQEPVSLLREKYLGLAHTIRKIGMTLVLLMPVIALLLRIPHLALITAVIGVLTMLVSVLLQVAVLPEEFDASFNKAMPILSTGYVPEHHLPAVKQVLRACAFTYVAAALADILSLWRWLAILR